MSSISSSIPSEPKNLPASSEAGSPATSPPHAPLVLRVGVTGHCPKTGKRPEPDVPRIRETVREILRCVADAFRGVANMYENVVGCAPDSLDREDRGTLRIISALAPGADQWVAEEAVALGYELQSPLPFPRDEYRKDFADDDSSAKSFERLIGEATAVMELDGRVSKDEQGERKHDSRSYEAVGRVVLAQSDLLLAVWDGEVAQGAGGTRQVVNEALLRGIPVVWVRWAEPARWEMLGCRWRLLQGMEDIEGDRERLTWQVRELLLPPSSEASKHPRFRRGLRQEYFLEKQKWGNPLLGWWLLFRDILCGEVFSPKRLWAWICLKPFRVENFEDETRKEWDQSWEVKIAYEGREKPPLRCPVDPVLTGKVDRAYSHHYAWANQLSIYYANLYRSSFVLNYLFGAMAVFFALAGMASGAVEFAAVGWVAAELALIAAVLLLTTVGRKRRWHERWIDYRTLAERIRLARFLVFLGGGGQQVAMADHLATYGTPTATWMHWHYRAIERAAGLPHVVVDKAFLESCQELWCENLVEDQKRYHAGQRDRFLCLDHRLHLLGSGLFYATLVVCLTHMALDLLGHGAAPGYMSRWLTLLAAFLPALGAAFAAIRSQGEFQRVAQRSAAMHDRLAQLQLDLAGAPARPAELSSVRLRECAGQVADLMINEMLDWRVVFQDRPLGLPS